MATATRLAVSKSLGSSLTGRSFTRSALALASPIRTRGSRSTRKTAHLARRRPPTTEPHALTAAAARPPDASPAPLDGTAKTYPWNEYNASPNAPAPTKDAPSSSAALVSDEGLRVPVVVPHDPEGVLDNAKGEWSDKARTLFAVSAIVVVRQLEMMNVLIGFEEANKYQLLSPEGNLLGYLMEEDLGFRGAMMRQALKTHRAFRATILDTEGNVILKIHRPFSWINSRIFVSAPSGAGAEADEQIIGEAQQEWHLYRRKYNQFVRRAGGMEQFGSTDSGFLAWDFEVKNERGEVIGSINRNFAGFGRELFTDTGQYVLRFEGVVADPTLALPPTSTDPSLPAPPSSSLDLVTSSADSTAPVSSVPSLIPLPSITFDQRAVMLASAVSIDFDYFTRSRGGLAGSGMGMFMPMPIPMGGGGGGAAGEVGAAGEGGVAAGEEGALPPTDLGQGGYGYGMGNEQGLEQGGDGGGSEGWGAEGGGGESPWAGEEQSMQDPWGDNQAGGGGEDGGTWSWGDLFPDE